VGTLSDYQVHAIIAPHLVNEGAGNTAWSGDFKGHPMLFAEARGASLAIASSVPWVVDGMT
jgi:glucoamylase